MENKQQLIGQLRDVYEGWRTLLADLPPDFRIQRFAPGGWSIKDNVAHLMAWQQVSNARMDAAVQGTALRLPQWREDFDLEREEPLDEINAWIYSTYGDQSWDEVYGAWSSGFERLIASAQSIPEDALLDTQRYPWLNGYALADVLRGTYEHHDEHLRSLKLWLH